MKTVDTIAANDLFTQLSEQVPELMDQLSVPGVAVGVQQGDQEHIATFGITSIDNPLPITEDTLFQIGSTTKTLTATTIMRLVEAGKLDLDEPVRTYLPSLRLSDPDVTNRVTLRHLLSHTGGWIGDFFIDTGTGRDAIKRAVARMHTLPQLTPLGTIWHYNNSGFYIAGRIIEVVTGKSYEQAVRDLLLDPLGMNMSFFTADDAITYRVAAGHNNHDRQGNPLVRVARPWSLPRNAAPAGNLVSTIKDQLLYARFHMSDGTAADGTRILSPESMRLMQTPRIEASNGEQFGLGWFIRDMNGTMQLRHGGATNGQMSAFVLVPSHQLAITILTNADQGRALYNKLTAAALEQYVSYTPPSDSPIESTPEDLQPYVGIYGDMMVDLHLSMQDGNLTLQPVVKQGGIPGQEAPPPEPLITLARYAPDKLVMLDGPVSGSHIEFIRTGDTIDWMRVSGRLYARQP